MPSSKNYVRDIAQEEKTAKARGDGPRNALRHKARRLELKRGLVHPGDGKDVDHKVPLIKGGSGGESNLRVESAHANRSYARTKNAGLK